MWVREGSIARRHEEGTSREDKDEMELQDHSLWRDCVESLDEGLIVSGVKEVTKPSIVY